MALSTTIRSTAGTACTKRSRIDRPNQRRYHGCRDRPTMTWVIPYSFTKGGDRADEVGAFEWQRRAAQLPGKIQIVADLPLGGRIDVLGRFARSLDIHGIPRGVHAIGHPRGLAQQRRGMRAPRTQADHHSLRAGSRLAACAVAPLAASRSSRNAISSIANSRSCVSFSGVKKFSIAVWIRSAG